MMKKIGIIHPAIISPIFKLYGLYEMDIGIILSDSDDIFTLRLELFRGVFERNLYRCKLWRNEIFRLQSRFPANEDNKPLHDPSDEVVLTEFSLPYFSNIDSFHAKSPEKALQFIIDILYKGLESVTLKSAVTSTLRPTP